MVSGTCPPVNNLVRFALPISLVVGLPFFFWGGPGYYSSRSFQAVWDLGHVLYFSLLTCWLHGWWRRRKGGSSSLVCCGFLFLLALVLGALVEVLQMLNTGRSVDVADVLRNQVGCLLACAFFIRPRPFALASMQRGFQGVVAVLLVVMAWPLCRSLIDEHLAARQFPVLADFETPFEHSRWNSSDQLREERAIVRHGQKSVRVQLSTNKFSGIALFYFPSDWRGYTTLHCSVYNPESTRFVLYGRIHDTHHKQNDRAFHDRFNQQFIVEPGWNDLEIALDKVREAPKGRTMDMANIEGFGLFVVQQPQALFFYLDHVYLSR